ncbi:Dnmt3a, partial [Symbiodinium sp. CCMP2456]
PGQIDEEDEEEKANNKAESGSRTAPAKAMGKDGDADAAADSNSGDSNATTASTKMTEISGVAGMMIAVVTLTNASGGRGTTTTLHTVSIATTNRVTKRDQKIAAIDFSFFDGLGTAFLVCDNHCKEHGLNWRGASWEIDEDLVKLGAKHFPDVMTRGDFEEETADSLSKLVQQLDPSRSAQVIIAAGPPCLVRIRQDAPGHDGTEGSKFTRFAQLIVNLEKSWNRSRATLLVENVIPQNRADVRKIEKLLDVPAVVRDSADFGTISRPRVWWCRIPWSEVAHRKDCPLSLRWTSMQGIPRVHFDVPKDDTQTWDTHGLALPRCLTEEMKPLPCLTTPSDDPNGAARLIFTMAVFAATVPTPTAELNPLGGTAIDITASLWQGKPPLMGPGPGDYDDFDLSYLDDPTEHWARSRIMPHPDPRRRFDLRHAVAEQIEEMVVDMSELTSQWFASLKPHVQKAYFSQQRTCSLQLPVLRIVCERFGWQDPDIFDELTRGFRLLGPIAPGLGWRKRNDLRCANPLEFNDFIDKNERYVRDKLRRSRVDLCWEQMANEIAEDVRLGRMEGPFTSPTSWPKKAVPLASHAHASRLLPGVAS